MRLGLILVIGLILPPQQVRAGDATEVSSTADAIIAAVKSGNAKTLGALAQSDDPDPWLVADELLRRGAKDAAEAFARADGRPEMIFMPAYVRDGPGMKTLAESRMALERARALMARGSPNAALAAVPAGTDEELAHVPGVELAYLQGDLLEELSRVDAAAAAYEHAAKRARTIGWDTMASGALSRAGYMLWMRSEFTRSAALFRKHMLVEEVLRSPMGIGRAHFRISSALYPLGHTEEANRHRAEAKRLALESGDALYAAKCLSDEGVAQARQGQSEAALKTFIASAAALNELDLSAFSVRMRPRAERVASSRVGSLSNAASMAAKLNRGHEAEDLLRQASDIAADSGVQRLATSARASLERLVGVRNVVAGRFAAALFHLEMASELYASLGNQAELADVLTRVGSTRASLGDLPTAIARLERAVSILTAIGAKRKLISAHLRTGATCSIMGRLNDAIQHVTTSVGLARELGDPTTLADALLSMAEVRRLAGQHGRAVEALNEAMPILRNHPDAARRADALIEQAAIQGFVGLHEEARDSIEEALEVLDGTVWTTRRNDALTFLASLLADGGEYEEARKTLDEVITFYRAGDSKSLLAKVLAVSGAHLLNGRLPKYYPAARERFEESVRLYTELGLTSLNTVRAQIGLGRALAWLHKDGRAIQALGTARRLSIELDHVPTQAAVLMALSEAAHLRGAFADGVLHAKAGAALIRNVGLDLDEDARAASRRTLEHLTLWGLASALHANDAASTYEFLERGRASALVASLGGRAAIREARVPKDLRLAEDEARAHAAVTYLQFQDARQTGNRANVRELRAKLTRARAVEAEALGAIQRTVRTQADLAYAAPTPIKEVQELVASGERLVLYGTDGYNFFACVLAPNLLQIVHLGTHREVSAAAEALIKEPDSAEKLAAVRKFIIDPLKFDASVTRWLASPTGPLTYVPYGALTPTKPVALVPSATALAILRGSPLPEGRHVLALGNPSYADRPQPLISYGSRLRGKDGDERGGGLVPLPGTEAEAKAVGDVVLLGKNASETMFRRVLGRQKRWRAVHFACHGLVDDVHATRCALALTHDAQNDGLLHANELYAQVDVAADLVVLSGCETGRGRIQSGEGLQGLTRAFMLSGAPRVLASLWRVDDEATRALMTKFYELWNPKTARATGVSASEALRQAQAYIRGHAKWKAPRYWAAWVLWGLPE